MGGNYVIFLNIALLSQSGSSFMQRSYKITTIRISMMRRKGIEVTACGLHVEHVSYSPMTRRKTDLDL